ncbi:MAG: glycosyltransferase [Porphyromonadaceae bacterium]|nr:MAG: glycosyltransferase [Porphyromonadaceae bacterium]
MIFAANILFWACVIAVFHSYVLFPAILRLAGAFRRLPGDYPGNAGTEPMVSILLSAYNEEDVIEEKIRSVFNTHYPATRFEILIGSDHSTDRTPEIIEHLTKEFPAIRFFNFTLRQGKPNVINKLVTETRGEILILTDANVIFDKNTLTRITAPFGDSIIGLVDTQMINLGMRREGISFQEKAYISREVQIKYLESRLWGVMMGPFGGCFAIRRELFEPVPANFLVDDFFLNMKVLESGYKAVNNPAARVYEDVSNDLSIEFKRKIRIATGNFQNLKRFKKLLSPAKPALAFCFFSHKVIRWMGPVFLLLALLALSFLAFSSVFYQVLLFAYIVVLLVPALDYLLKKLNLHFKIFRFITHFLGMNLALSIGMVRYLKGVKTNVWQPTKRHQ